MQDGSGSDEAPTSVADSPRYKEAMNSLGITKKDLERVPLSEFRVAPTFSSRNKRAMWRRAEKHRQKLLQEIADRRQELINMAKREEEEWATAVKIEAERSRQAELRNQKNLQNFLANAVLQAQKEERERQKREDDAERLRKRREQERMDARLKNRQNRSTDRKRDEARRRAEAFYEAKRQRALNRKQEIENKMLQRSIRMDGENRRKAEEERRKEEERKAAYERMQQLERERIEKVQQKRAEMTKRQNDANRKRAEDRERRRADELMQLRERQLHVERTKRMKQYQQAKLHERLENERRRMREMKEYQRELVANRIQLQEHIRIHKDAITELVQRTPVAALARLTPQQINDLGFPEDLATCLVPAFNQVCRQFSLGAGDTKRINLATLAAALKPKTPFHGKALRPTTPSGNMRKLRLLTSPTNANPALLSSRYTATGSRRSRAASMSGAAPARASRPGSARPVKIPSRRAEAKSARQDRGQATGAATRVARAYGARSARSAAARGRASKPRKRSSDATSSRIRSAYGARGASAGSTRRKTAARRPKSRAGTSRQGSSLGSRAQRRLEQMKQQHQEELLELLQQEEVRENDRRKLLSCVTGDEKAALKKMFKRERDSMSDRIAMLSRKQENELQAAKRELALHERVKRPSKAWA